LAICATCIRNPLFDGCSRENTAIKSVGIMRILKKF
jgi:hypothetical protein